MTGIGRKAGIHPAAVSRILRGEREPKVGAFMRLAETIGVPERQLYEYLKEVRSKPMTGNAPPVRALSPFAAMLLDDPSAGEAEPALS